MQNDLNGGNSKLSGKLMNIKDAGDVGIDMELSGAGVAEGLNVNT